MAQATNECRRSCRPTGAKHVLVCAECGLVSDDGTGWRAMLAVGNEDAEDVDEVAVYCPECAAREFGGP